MATTPVRRGGYAQEFPSGAGPPRAGLPRRPARTDARNSRRHRVATSRFRRSHFRRAAARSAASARSSPPTRSPAPASMTVPIATSPGAPGSARSSQLSYDSGSGNGPFGFGWSLSPAGDHPQDRQGLAAYRDAEESDVFILSGAEDLVPGRWTMHGEPRVRRRRTAAPGYRIRRYRPRIEGLFARIERWTKIGHRRRALAVALPRQRHSRSTARTATSRDRRPGRCPAASSAGCICETRDDKGNAVVYDYKAEDGAQRRPWTGARAQPRRPRRPRRGRPTATSKRIRYGNRVPLLDTRGAAAALPDARPARRRRLVFEVVFDYGEHDRTVPLPDAGQGASPGPAAPTRSPPTAPASRSARTGSAGAS